MTTEHSTYTHEDGTQETVTLKRGPATPPGHALLRIKHDDGKTLDCYVNTAWLRDRLNDLGAPCPVPAVPRPLTPDAITDEMVERAAHCLAMQRMPTTYSLEPDSTADRYYDDAREILAAALTEPPARPEGAEEVDGLVEDWMATLDEDPDLGGADDRRSLADYLAARLADPTRKED